MRFFLKPIIVLFGVMTILSGAAVWLGKDFSSEPFQDLGMTMVYRDYDPNSQITTTEVRLIHAQSGRSWPLPASVYGGRLIRWTPDYEWLFYEVPSVDDNSMMRIHWSGNRVEQINVSEWDSTWSISPDERWIAWLDVEPMESTLFLADIDYHNIRQLQEHIPFGYAAHELVPNLFWSPNGEWIYVIDNMTYLVGENRARFPLEIFRIRPDGSDFEKLVSIEEEWLERVDVSDDYIVFVTSLSRSDDYTFYALKLSDTTLRQVFQPNEMQFLPDPRLESDKVIFGGIDGNFELIIMLVDLQDGHGRPIFESFKISDFNTANDVRWSQNGNAFDLHGYNNHGEYIRLLSDDLGEHPTFIRNDLCNIWAGQERESLWQGETLYFFDRSDDDICRLLQLSEDFEHTTVMQVFPLEARDFRFVGTREVVWVAYDLNRTTYLTNFDGTEGFTLQPYLPGQLFSWVEIPIPERDYRWAIVVGVLCLSGTVVGTRLSRFRA